MNADMVFTNGHVATMDPKQPVVSAVALHDGKILAIGEDDPILDLRAPKGEWIDLGGRAMVPGLVDAHVHFQGYSIFRQKVDLDEATSLDEVLGRIAQYVGQKSSNPRQNQFWVEGRGWTQNAWVVSEFPTAAALDRVTADSPACLYHKSGHAVWVNSKALQIAAITRSTEDPPGGQIQRDDAGKPTGILFEEAINLVSNLIPAPSVDEIADAMLDAQSYCWQAGLTGIHDFDGRSCFQALQQLNYNGLLGLRVIKNIPVKRLEHAVGVGLRSGFGNDWLRIGGVKIFADGALGPKTAAMVEPYESDTQNFGIVVTDKEEMMSYASKASANGLSVTVHAIGDRANHDILDVYQAVRAEEQERGETYNLRHRIEHVQLLHPSDLNRLADLRIIASMQPTHATSDMIMADKFWGERAQYSYAFRTVLQSGATLVFGSDAPIEKIDPLPGIYAAVTRRRADGFPGEDGWYPQQKLTLNETIRAFTLAAAETSGQEKRFGSIMPGKAADLTIFDRDIFSITHDELLQAAIEGTVVGGEFKYRNLD